MQEDKQAGTLSSSARSAIELWPTVQSSTILQDLEPIFDTIISGLVYLVYFIATTFSYLAFLFLGILLPPYIAHAFVTAYL